MTEPTCPSLIELVPFDDTHVHATFEWLKDPQLRRSIDTLEAPTPKGHAAYWHRRLLNPDERSYAIMLHSGEHIGNCGLVSIDHLRGSAELWIYIAACRGKGAGACAAQLLLKEGFCTLQLHRIMVRVLSTNAPALKFFQALGFVREGLFREDTICEGKRIDSFSLSLLAREFNGSGCVS